MVRKKKIKRSLSERIFHGIIVFLILLLAFTCLYPFWNVVVIAFNEGKDTALGGVTFWPRKFTIENFEVVFQDKTFLNSILVSFSRVMVGTCLSIMATSIFAFGMAQKDLIGRRLYMKIAIITMYFGGGLIPTYLWLRQLGLFNNFWVLVIPGTISVYNMIIFRTFFSGIPASLLESANIDGCGYFKMFLKIIMPLSKPVYATLSLFTAVWLWNDWFTGVIYINNPKLIPLQTYLMSVMNSANFQAEMSKIAAQYGQVKFEMSATTRSLQMATIVVGTLPILIFYPFVQRYFVKGVMIGSIKE